MSMMALKPRLRPIILRAREIVEEAANAAGDKAEKRLNNSGPGFYGYLPADY
jgi:hypothetical protein